MMPEPIKKIADKIETIRTELAQVNKNWAACQAANMAAIETISDLKKEITRLLGLLDGEHNAMVQASAANAEMAREVNIITGRHAAQVNLNKHQAYHISNFMSVLETIAGSTAGTASDRRQLARDAITRYTQEMLTNEGCIICEQRDLEETIDVIHG